MSRPLSPSQKDPEKAVRWIGAEHALLHVERNRSRIETVFQRHDIEKSQYAVYAGFDESCIRRGLGFFEQIHIFTLSTILATSPLLTELGQSFSPTLPHFHSLSTKLVEQAGIGITLFPRRPQNTLIVVPLL